MRASSALRQPKDHSPADSSKPASSTGAEKRSSTDCRSISQHTRAAPRAVHSTPVVWRC